MMTSPDQPKRKRKRIQRKITVADIALKEVFSEREPEGLTFAERQYLKIIGMAIAKKYRQMYGKNPDCEEKAEPWRFGRKGEEQLVYKKFKVAVYPLTFKGVIIQMLKENKPDQIYLRQMA